MANEQGKDVFAMPGSIHSPLAKGCHSLIKQGAKLAESAEDILEELKLRVLARVARHPRSPRSRTQALFAELGFDPCDIDTLAARSGASAETFWPRSSRNGRSKASSKRCRAAAISALR